MEKYKKLLEDIENASNLDVVKKRCISGIGAVLVLVGIVCIIVAKGADDPNSSFPTFLFTIAAILCLSGIIKICISSTCYLYKPTKSKLQSLTLYFDTREGDELQNLLEVNRLDDLKRLNKKKDGTIKMEVMMTKDDSFVALQLLEYIPYAYETATPVWCYRDDAAKKLAAYIKS